MKRYILLFISAFLIVSLFAQNKPKGNNTSSPKQSTNTLNKSTLSISTSNKDLIFSCNLVSFEMVYVMGGVFTIGKDGAITPVNGNFKDVILSDFWIGKYEVTQQVWFALMGTKMATYTYKYNYGYASKYIGNKYPMIYISYYDCVEFCNKLNQLYSKQLEEYGLEFVIPTEAEWEYAAKGGIYSKSYIYSGSNDYDEVAWIYKEGESTGLHYVGLKKPNELGIYDMSGNVYEWCGYLGESYSNIDINNPRPINSKNDYTYIRRGGSFGDYSSSSKCIYRQTSYGNIGAVHIGFRLCLRHKK